MDMNAERELKRDIELAELMVKDLQKMWASYAKKALEAKQERELRRVRKGFLEYESKEELIEAWGGAYIDEDTYYRGLDYFENLKKPPALSVIELHREKLKDMLNSWKGTLKMLQEELNPPEKMPEENAFDRLDREEREKRFQVMRFSDSISGGGKNDDKA